MEWTASTVKALRAAMRLPQPEFGERVGVDQRTISSWECGKVRTIRTASVRLLDDLYEGLSASQRERFTQMMNVLETDIVLSGRDDLGSRHFPQGAELPLTGHDRRTSLVGGDPRPLAGIEKEDEVNRRSFGAVGAIGGIALMSSGLLPDQQSLPVTARLGLDDVRGWIAYADQLEHRDQRHGGAGLVQEASTALLRASHELDTGSYDPTTATAAASAVGHIAVMTGWVAYDADNQDLARTCYREALELAARSGDDALAVHSLLNAANQEAALARRGTGNPHMALHYASRAGQLAQRWNSGRVHALIAVRKAQAWGLIGARDHFRAAMTEAHSAMNTALESELLSHCPQWLRFVDPAELAGHEARAHLDLGDPRTALGLFEQALQGRSIRNELGERAWYSTTLASVGDSRGAITEAEAVLTALEDVRSTRALRVLAPVRHLAGVPDEFADHYDQIDRKAVPA